MAGQDQQQIDLRIDRFVHEVNGSPRESLDASDVPRVPARWLVAARALRVSWVIVPARSHAKWIDDLEAKLPGRLPRSYRSFVSRYLFPAFDIGKVTLFASTGRGVQDELVDAVFRDSGLYAPLLKAGFVQFGRPASGGYDPVCFDVSRMTKDGECPVVQLDHEAALMGERVRIVTEIADSFLSLVGV